jgi:23S rRNA (adenine2030-N6)-methyltransferase
MNYRHAYHAGNFADVLKHIVLVYVLEHLAKKSKPFRFIDTHAGIGLYDLGGEEARKTGEWRDGIGKLIAAVQADEQAATTAALRDDPTIAAYLAAIERCCPTDADTVRTRAVDLTCYPGSPALAAALLRPGDAAIVNELHPHDAEKLEQLFDRNKQVKVLNLDGWLVPKSVLPPKERRGVTLIDPPFEIEGEFHRMCRALTDGLRRFATGIFILWYPIKDEKPVSAFKLDAASRALQPMLAVELYIRAPGSRDVLNGCGLLIHTPPFGLREWLERMLPALTSILAQAPGATWRLETI